MLQALSFLVVVTMLAGTIGFIAATMRASAESVLSAMNGIPKASAMIVPLPRRPIRQARPATPHFAPLRAAA